jgi:uncharacterized membrane protein YgcG
MLGKKGAIGIFGLVLVGLVILGVMYLVQSGWISRGFKIKADARIFVDVNDESSKIVSILKSRTDEYCCMEFLARDILSLLKDASESELADLADEMDLSLTTYDKEGKMMKKFGEREVPEQNLIYVEIPLPGGETTFIGIASDLKPDDYGEFSGGGGGEMGGGGAGGGW